MKSFLYIFLLLALTACSSGKNMNIHAKTAQQYVDDHSFQLLRMYCDDWDRRQSAEDYKKYCVDHLNAEEEAHRALFSEGDVDYDRVYGLSEKKRYKKTVKIPFTAYGKNANGYYALKKTNPLKTAYAEKFKKYSLLIYENKFKLKNKQILQINNSGNSARVVNYPGYVGDQPKVLIPDGTFLYFDDYSITKGLFGDVVYFIVEYKGIKGYLAEFQTDRNMYAVIGE